MKKRTKLLMTVALLLSVIGITVDTMDEVGFAELVCFFEVACGISGYMLGVNPFDQPGVEAYKKNLSRIFNA